MPLGGGRAPGWRAHPWVEGAPLGGGRAPGWRARPWVEGAPLGGGRAQSCLIDWEGRAPVDQGAPKVEWHVENLLIQHTVSRWCSSGCVQEGCGGVDRWLQTKD